MVTSCDVTRKTLLTSFELRFPSQNHVGFSLSNVNKRFTIKKFWGEGLQTETLSIIYRDEQRNLAAQDTG